MASIAEYVACADRVGLRQKYKELWKGTVRRTDLKPIGREFGACAAATW
jgi:hypothetical protein